MPEKGNLCTRPSREQRRRATTPPSTRGQARMDAAFSHHAIKSTDTDCIDKLVDQTSIPRFKVDIFKQSKPKHPFNI